MWKKYFILTVTILFILLFTYAATSKLIDFYSFTFQLGKSPLIPQSLTKLTAFAIPIGELIIISLLIIDKFRILGLFLSFFLMTLFTIYLFYITQYSYYIPCSCGGILGKMDWNTHIYFNLFCVLIAVISILIYKVPSHLENKSLP